MHAIAVDAYTAGLKHVGFSADTMPIVMGWHYLEACGSLVSAT